MSDASDWAGPPDLDELEVSLFGPGKGESVLVHVGESTWFVVDSCLGIDGHAAPLTYLAAIGVPFAAVDFVLATHWHDDHVGGLAEILRESPTARFVCSQALNADEFPHLVAAADWSAETKTTSGVRQFAQVMEELTASGRSPEWAIASRVLRRRSHPRTEIVALSPSDESVTESLTDIARRLRSVQGRRLAIPRPRRNPAAVVIQVVVDQISVLLCSDLEVDANPNKGWEAVLDAPGRPDETANLVKVAHHGSHNGHHDRVWSEMIDPAPVAALTPFLRGRPQLPRDTDLDRIRALTPDGYITRMPGMSRPVRDRRAQRMAQDATRWITTEPRSTGTLRFRRPIDGSAPWRVDLWGTATRLGSSSTR